MSPHKGQRVIWTDPDPDGSGEVHGKVWWINGEVIGIDPDHGGYIEAFAHELRPENS